MIKRIWSTRESLDTIGTCMECMPKNAFQDIYTCLHFDDDWDDNEWGDVYADEKRCNPKGTAHHHGKLSMFVDGFNLWYKECLNFGRLLIFNKSRIAGCYHSPVMQGPDLTPICTGATIHSLAITHSDLSSYKVHVRVFGGATVRDLDKMNDNTITTQKWVNMLLLMLDSFKNNAHCITMDSAYMGDIMAMIGRGMWRINMVRTAQANRTGATSIAQSRPRREQRMAPSVGSIPGNHFVFPCGPTTLFFRRPRDTRGGLGGVVKEK